MNTILQTLMCIAAFLGGIFIGTSVNSKKYQEGRLSACNDIIKQLPGSVGGGVMCIPYEGDVAISIEGKLFSVDGGKPLN